jgi:cytochrome c oxidase subunit 2
MSAPLLLLPLAQVPANQSTMYPTGVQAARIYSLFWGFVWVCTVVWVVVMIFMLWGALRAPARRQTTVAEDQPDTKPEPGRERRMSIVVGGAVGVTTVILLVLMVSEFLTTRSLAGLARSPDAKNAVNIAVTARQWWWEVQYQDATPSNMVTTANEIHIPVGRPVVIQLQSPDVIHSFWVPNLAGKKDAVPGHPTQIWLRADEPGFFQGQCAEFCGAQHANMRFIVIAEPQDKFDAWLDAQRQPAREPTTDAQWRGKTIFLSTTCATCHSISGTPAFGRVGPNLTHVASRAVLAAGAVPNRPGHLAGWIIDPQKIKPGTRMPQHSLPPADLRNLLEYLESLK